MRPPPAKKRAPVGEFYERALGNDAGRDVSGSEKPRVGHQSRSTWRRGPRCRNSTARVQCASPFPTPGRAVRKATAAAAFAAVRAIRPPAAVSTGEIIRDKQCPPTEPQEHQRAKSELAFTTVKERKVLPPCLQQIAVACMARRFHLLPLPPGS